MYLQGCTAWADSKRFGLPPFWSSSYKVASLVRWAPKGSEWMDGFPLGVNWRTKNSWYLFGMIATFLFVLKAFWRSGSGSFDPQPFFVQFCTMSRLMVLEIIVLKNFPFLVPDGFPWKTKVTERFFFSNDRELKFLRIGRRLGLKGIRWVVTGLCF